MPPLYKWGHDHGGKVLNLFYILGVFSAGLVPLGEYFFDYKGKIEVENRFLTRRGLFINKPEQESEDEYEFYHVDRLLLSGIKKPDSKNVPF